MMDINEMLSHISKSFEYVLIGLLYSNALGRSDIAQGYAKYCKNINEARYLP